MLPDPKARRQEAMKCRTVAAQVAFDRKLPAHTSNDEEKTFGGADGRLVACFTKGLPHQRQTGLIGDPADFKLFVAAIDTGKAKDIRKIPIGPPGNQTGKTPNFRSAMASSPPADLRGWESMGAGLAHDLEGPDAQAVTMPPAPKLDSAELSFEISEAYWMALLRDVRFTDFDTSADVKDAIKSLNALDWVAKPDKLNLKGKERMRVRERLNPQTAFRGSLKGDSAGPYLSQFLLVGTKGLGNINGIEDGYIQYGALRIDQRVRVAQPGRDYMTSFEAWLDVQNAADLSGRESYVQNKDKAFRFMSTPRDLATYVHYDALYEAYLNACLILLDIKAPFDKGLPFINPDDSVDKQRGFATFGPPHVLSLVTEVATRALKAIRFQKFNVHRRLRPEAVCQLMDGFKRSEDKKLYKAARTLDQNVDDDLQNRVLKHNREMNRTQKDGKSGENRSSDFDPFGETKDGTYLLPMAFAEGSPMHPSYGAGHAAVAGACVTVLKAFFDTDYELPFAFEPTNNGSDLKEVTLKKKLTVLGELNKVCSNVSIGRNWAGVHYYSDYFESIRLGEEIAIGILEEQKDTYHEKFTMTIPCFDGTVRVIE